MNWRDAHKAAKKLYPGRRPIRASGFCPTEDGKAVIVAGLDDDVAIVIYDERSLSRLRTMIEIVEARIEGREPGDNRPRPGTYTRDGRVTCPECRHNSRLMDCDLSAGGKTICPECDARFLLTEEMPAG